METNNNSSNEILTENNPIQETVIHPNAEQEVMNDYVSECRKCGAKLRSGQIFCSQCGTKAVNDIPPNNNDIHNNSVNTATSKKKTSKKLIILFSVIGAVIIGVVAFFIVRGTPVEKIRLGDTNLTLEESQFYNLEYTIEPEDATNKEVTWTSSDEDIAKVNNDGQITAVSEGTCKITVTASNGVKAECNITVEEAGPDLLDIYNCLDDDYYCELGYDYSYLMIDTNPLDLDDYSSYTAHELIQEANDLLGLPASVLEKMGNTTALSGTQTYQAHKLNVSWTYHPDNGLEVIYERTE
ncbi:MAG: Ig-like domain-containing protein [Ruminococcus sp.]